VLDLTTVTASLTTLATAVAQVILPDAADTQGVDTAALLTSQVGAQISNRVYPVMLPDTPTYPAAAYQQVSAERIEVDGYPILRDDTYLLAVLAETYGAAISQADTILDALIAYDPASAAGSMSIVDQGDDYDNDFQLWEKGMTVRVSHLARTSQTLPAAFVYTLGEDFELGESLQCVTGQAVSRFAVTWVAKIPANGVSALSTVRNQILAAVAGLKPAGWSRIWPDGGEIVAVHSAHVVWRDTFACIQTRSYQI